MSKLLPIPADPNYQIPAMSEAEFNQTNGDTDAVLLADGSWDDDDDDEIGYEEDEGGNRSPS